MYLLIPSPVTTGLYFDSNLHPTMYLLILAVSIETCLLCYLFTSHYVSINSSLPCRQDKTL